MRKCDLVRNRIRELLITRGMKNPFSPDMSQKKLWATNVIFRANSLNFVVFEGELYSLINCHLKSAYMNEIFKVVKFVDISSK